MKALFSNWYVMAMVCVLTFSAQATGNDERIPDWVLSFSTGDQCHCRLSQASSSTIRAASRKIVPTPVGGQSVAQVCERMGPGPGLLIENGKFNYPVYSDLQCGNGPSIAASADSGNENCEGQLHVDGSVCLGSGPTWNFTAAFSEDNNSTAETATAEVEEFEQPETTTELAVASTPAETTTIIEYTVDATEGQTQAPEVITSLPTVDYDDSPVIGDSTGDMSTFEMATLVTEAEELSGQTSIGNENLEAPIEPAAMIDEQMPSVIDDPIVSESMMGEESIMVESTSPTIETVVTDSVETDTNVAVEDIEPTLASALRIPLRGRTRFHDLSYLQFSPVGYDFGGNGASIEGSLGFASNWRLVANAVATEDYDEVMIGAGYATPLKGIPNADLSLTLGVERGNFDLGITDFEDTGGVIHGSIGFALSRSFNFALGVSYSSFFDGDPAAYAMGLFRLTNQLDLAGRIETSDNDNVGLGLRYHFK